MARICYHADESFQDPEDSLYNIIRIVEDEPGYHVTTGCGSLAWAKAYAKALNDQLGLTADDVLNIRMSSMMLTWHEA